MQTITLHLRSSLKQRNSYALGESVETESHHQEGMAEWLCDGLQIHLPWFESEYPLQNTDTQEMLMSKNPYEVRLETLKMAKEMVDQQFNLQMDLMFNMIDQAKESGENVKDAYDKYVPDMYKPEHVIDKAQELYKYVSEKK